MRLHVQSDSGVTVIENLFIDQYMPAANGEFVKLYLYLLRCAGTGRDLSISSVADFFDHTEKDVKRALSYWEKLDLLHLTYDAGGSISDIVLGPGSAGASSAPAPLTQSDPVPVPDSVPVRTAETSVQTLPPVRTAAPMKAAIPSHTDTASPSVQLLPEREIPSRHAMSPARRKVLAQEENIRALIHVYSTYLGRPLTSTETHNIMYFSDQLGFSFELIDYLIEYCVSKNAGTKYMEKVAQEWYREGITTVPQAKESSAGHNQEYYQIFRALGIRSHVPAEAEIAFMDCWLNTWHIPLDLIELACERTILQAHKPSFTYTNKILDEWHQAGVQTPEDVRKLDQEHLARTAAPATGQHRPKMALKGGNNIAAHEYDWETLEQQLILAQEGE